MRVPCIARASKSRGQNGRDRNDIETLIKGSPTPIGMAWISRAATLL